MDSGRPQSVADVGEFGLLRRIRERIGQQVGQGSGVLIGPGDDAALVVTGTQTLAAADILVEGMHFDLALSRAADAGYKALAVNVSDIAAMGGLARYALLSLAAPPSTTTSTIDQIFDGFLDAAQEMGVSLVGGDVSAAPQIVLSVAIIGEPGAGGVVGRGGAKPGDVACVTGTVGGAAAGLGILRAVVRGRSDLADRFPLLIAAHRRPAIRIHAGPAAAAAGAAAMIDVSDGLARDLGHLAEESGIGVVLDAKAVPMPDELPDAAAQLGLDLGRMAVAGGDDYELCMAVPQDCFDAVAEAIRPLSLTRIGVFSDDPTQRVLRSPSGDTALNQIGWEHFA